LAGSEAIWLVQKGELKEARPFEVKKTALTTSEILNLAEIIEISEVNF